MKQHARWWPLVGALVGGGLGLALGIALAGDDLDKLGDWRNGAARFIGMAGAIGVFAGYVIVKQVLGGKRMTRDGFTLTYRPISPTTEGYREMKIATVADVLAGLAKVGYEPRAEACDEVGVRSGSVADETALPGANIAIVDPRVKGWIRLALPLTNDTQRTALGLIEIWSEGGDSAEELALFTLRTLDGLVEELAAARESSRLSPDPIPLLTAGLTERAHRAP